MALAGSLDHATGTETRPRASVGLIQSIEPVRFAPSLVERWLYRKGGWQGRVHLYSSRQTHLIGLEGTLSVVRISGEAWCE